MRRIVPALLCLTFIAQTVFSQLTFTPKIGVESSRTLVSVDNSKFLAPVPSQFSPQLGIKLDYQFKKGHGLFAGFSTSHSNTGFNFSNPETSLTNYSLSKPTTMFRLEGGYQFNTKPIYFKNSSSNRKSATQKTSGCSSKQSSAKQRCGSYSRSQSHCEKKKSEVSKQKVNKQMTFVRLQPQLGVAYIPSVKNDFASKMEGSQASYTYNAGNWNTAIISGMGFEFGKGKTRLFQLTLQYLKGIGNMDNTILTTQSGAKSVETSFASRASSWSLSFGFPISLAKKPAAKNKTKQRNHCEQKMRSSCGGMRRI